MAIDAPTLGHAGRFQEIASESPKGASPSD
jgi:hypothetical protein